MHYTHEYEVAVEESALTVYSDWTDVVALPESLSHVRATARGEADDLGRLVIMLDGRHVEFPVQRTMCARDTICWQSLGNSFLYVLTIMIEQEPLGGSRVTINVSYDPPGFLPDVIETLGRSKIFRQEFEADMRRYAQKCRSPKYALTLD